MGGDRSPAKSRQLETDAAKSPSDAKKKVPEQKARVGRGNVDYRSMVAAHQSTGFNNISAFIEEPTHSQRKDMHTKGRCAAHQSASHTTSPLGADTHCENVSLAPAHIQRELGETNKCPAVEESNF